MEILGLRAASRALGISHVGLLKAASTGRVSRNADGTFEVEQCRLQLAQNSHPTKSRSARMQQAPVQAVEAGSARMQQAPVQAVEAGPGLESDPAAAVAPDPLSFDLLPDSESTAEATRLLEWERLREKRLKVDRDEGKLVDVAAINAFVAGMILQAREELTRIPTEMRDQLAHEQDPLRCEELLSLRIEGVLGKMSEYRRGPQ